MARRCGLRLLQLTDDADEDIDCAWHPSGDRIVFAWDRDDPRGGRHSIYELNASGEGEIRPLVSSASNDTRPRWSEDGQTLGFLSDRSGTVNLHRMDMDTARVRAVTNLVGGIFGWDFVDDKSMVASIFERRRFRLFEFPSAPVGAQAGTPGRLPQPSSPLPRTAAEPALAETPPAQEYDVDLSLDYVQSVIALDPDLPYGTGASFGFTDLLGTHQVLAHISAAFDQLRLVDLNLGLSYSNLGSRWSRHMGLFRVSIRPRLTVFSRARYSEVRTGAFFGVTYPVSRYRRFEISTVWRRLVRDETFGLVGETGNTYLASLYGSYVHDNTLWSWNGPRRGWRWNVTLGESLDLLGRGFDRQTVQFDWRHYTELLPRNESRPAGPVAGELRW